MFLFISKVRLGGCVTECLQSVQRWFREVVKNAVVVKRWRGRPRLTGWSGLVWRGLC